MAVDNYKKAVEICENHLGSNHRFTKNMHRLLD